MVLRHRTSARFFQEYSLVLPSHHLVKTSVMQLFVCPLQFVSIASKAAWHSPSPRPMSLHTACTSTPTTSTRSRSFGGGRPVNAAKSVEKLQPTVTHLYFTFRGHPFTACGFIHCGERNLHKYLAHTLY